MQLNSSSEMKKIKDTLTNSNLDSSLFRRIAFLGQGSFGSVEKVKYIGTLEPKFYAIKTLQITKCSELTSEDAEREVKMLERIKKMEKKPSAFPIFYGYTHFKNSEMEEYKLYMDYKNQDLEEFCDRPISFSNFKDLALQLIHALAYLETYNMCHRDIKPKNILIEEDGKKRLKATLIDFGVSKKFQNSERINELSIVVGTKNYLAPELLIALENQINEKKLNRINSFKADVFSLGLVFIRVITGKYLNIRTYDENFESSCRSRIKALIRKFKEKLDVDKYEKDYEEKRFFCDQVKEMLNFDSDSRPSFIQLVFSLMDHQDMKKVRNHILVEEGKLLNMKIEDVKEEKKEEVDRTNNVNKTYDLCEFKTNNVNKTYDFCEFKEEKKIFTRRSETYYDRYDRSRSLIPKPTVLNVLNSDELKSLIPKPPNKNRRKNEMKRSRDQFIQDLIDNIETYPINFDMSIKFQIKNGSGDIEEQDIIDFFYDEEAETIYPNNPIQKVHFNLNGYTGYFRVKDHDFARHCSMKSGQMITQKQIFLTVLPYEEELQRIQSRY